MVGQGDGKVNHPYATIYTREEGKIELTEYQWRVTDSTKLVPLTFHRVDGPAMIFSSGEETYWLDDSIHFPEKYNQIIDQVKSMSDTEKLLDSRWWVREMVK